MLTTSLAPAQVPPEVGANRRGLISLSSSEPTEWCPESDTRPGRACPAGAAAGPGDAREPGGGEVTRGDHTSQPTCAPDLKVGGAR